MSFDFYPKEQDAAMLAASRNPSTTPDPGIWGNFGSGAGNYTMRGLAEVGRAVSMAGAVVPIIADKLVGNDFGEHALTDLYFRNHDAVFNNAVDHWTPRPGEVGTAGQVVGQLAGGVMQAVISPALLMGTTQLSSAEDLVRTGVDATTANTVGAVQGAGMAVGLKLPYLGQSLLTRVLSGSGGNVAQGVATAAASAEVLKANGYEKNAEQYNPWDLRARALDVMLGAAFGGLAHIEAKGAPKLPAPEEAPKLSATQEAALLVINQARHIEDATPQGRPATDADATMHADAMRQAVDQLLRGEPVAVDGLTQGMRMVPDDTQYQQRAEVTAEAHRIAEQDAPIGAPIRMDTTAKALLADTAANHDPASLKARQFASEQPDFIIPTERVNPDGSPINLKASDAIAQTDAAVAHAQTTAVDLFKTAAHCLLGAL